MKRVRREHYFARKKLSVLANTYTTSRRFHHLRPRLAKSEARESWCEGCEGHNTESKQGAHSSLDCLRQRGVRGKPWMTSRIYRNGHLQNSGRQDCRILERNRHSVIDATTPVTLAEPLVSTDGVSAKNHPILHFLRGKLTWGSGSSGGGPTGRNYAPMKNTFFK